jgi:hypothetical protein
MEPSQARRNASCMRIAMRMRLVRSQPRRAKTPSFGPFRLASAHRLLARLDQMEADFARMNRVSMMGELAASVSRNHATDRQCAQQRPCGPEFSGYAAAGP